MTGTIILVNINSTLSLNHNRLIALLLVSLTHLFPISDLELKPVGVLEVKLVQAKDLTNKDIVGKSDPFAKLYIRPLRERTKTSKTIVSFT